MNEFLLRVARLRTHYRTKEGVVRAVDDVSLGVGQGELVGLVGESGSGKSQLALSVMGLVEPPGWLAGGEVWLDQTRLNTSSEREMNRLRGRDLAMVFQDPMSSLNPVLTVGDQASESLRTHGNGAFPLRVISEVSGFYRWTPSYRTQRSQTIDNFARVGIPSPETRFSSFPHQFSGGMRQRVLISSCLGFTPRLLIADEPTTALDVTVQAQVLALLKELVQDLQTSLLLITHDLGIVAENCDRVYVMRRGRIVEFGDVTQVICSPHHPYTRRLIDSVPDLDSGGDWLNPRADDPRVRRLAICDASTQSNEPVEHYAGHRIEVEPSHVVWCYHD